MGRYLDTNSCVLSLLLRSDELGVLVTCSRPIATKQQELGRQGCKQGAFDKQTDSVCLLVQVHLDDIFEGGLKAEIIYSNIFTQTDSPSIEVKLKIILDKNIQQYMVKMVKGAFKRKKTPGKSLKFVLNLLACISSSTFLSIWIPCGGQFLMQPVQWTTWQRQRETIC